MKATGFTSTAQGSAVIQKRGTTLPVTTLTPECRGRANTHGLAFSLLVQKTGVGRNGTLVKPCTLQTSSSPLLSLVTPIAEARGSDAVAVVHRKATLTRNRKDLHREASIQGRRGQERLQVNGYKMRAGLS